MQLNRRVKVSPILTHEGGPAIRITPEQQLSRTLMSCLLWEDGFYEDGQAIADRLKDTMLKVAPDKVAAMVLEARNSEKLRHAPLFLIREMARVAAYKPHVASLLEQVVQRPAELTEALAMYWKDQGADKRDSVSAQFKKGLAKAFRKFSAYQLAKYNRDSEVKLKDVMLLCHPKPRDKEQAATWKKLLDGTLESPDTWEVALSSGADKKETWIRLIKEQKLGSLALIRNLRNMIQVAVPSSVVRAALLDCDPVKLLPYQLISAAQHAPQYEPEIETLLLKLLEGNKKLPGKTMILVDISTSMNEKLSGKGERTRMDVACSLAILLREVCEQVGIVSFSNHLAMVPARRGFALRDSILNSQHRAGTQLGGAIRTILAMPEQPDRLVVITDEQSSDAVVHPKCKAYMLNVGVNQNAVGYGPWVRIDGWSENCVEFIRSYESQD